MSTPLKDRPFRVTWTEVQHVKMTAVVKAKTKDHAVEIAKKLPHTDESVKAVGLKPRIKNVCYEAKLGALP